jgi:hypothetical protein
MPIKWKKSSRFSPNLVLNKIGSVRTIGPDGGASFSGFEIDDYLPTLESLLEFPAVADGLDKSILVWKAVAKADDQLAPETFLKTINKQLSALLDVKDEIYVLLTEISISYLEIPKSVKINNAEIKFWENEFPARYRNARENLLSEHKVSVEPTPLSYCKVTVTVRAKSPSSAFHKAMSALDVQRALWCLMANSTMQITFGGSSNKPVNTVRLGSRHTLHTFDGDKAIDQIWYEPNFKEASVVQLKQPEIVLKNSKHAIRRMLSCSYGGLLQSSLIRYVRALDESEANTAFLRLWGALESLTTPGVANYDSLVKRCSFIYAESAYHRQVLEHLREYRNASVHAGEESNKARTHCFQLQRYYRNIFWFHIRNFDFFKSVDEANSFLDSSEDKETLLRQLKIIKKALKFKSS